MTRGRDVHLWELARAERTALAEDMATLTAEQWRHETLCPQWDVEQVLAHLTAAASLNQWLWLRSMFGARFRADVHNQRRLAEYRGKTPTETLNRFRAVIGSTTAPSGHTPAYLGEVLVHSTADESVGYGPHRRPQPSGHPAWYRTLNTYALTPCEE